MPLNPNIPPPLSPVARDAERYANLDRRVRELERLAWGGTITTIYNNTLNSGATFDVTGIQSAFAHLRFVLYARGTVIANAVEVRLRFNNDTGANYSYELFTSAATVLTGAEGIAQTFARMGRCPGASAPASSYGSINCDVANYANAIGHKAATAQSASRENTTTGNTVLEENSVVWFSTSAINQVTIYPSSGNFASGSRLTIYGIG